LLTAIDSDSPEEVKLLARDWEKRYDSVGGLPRFVLPTHDQFLEQESNMDSNLGEFFGINERTNVYHIPEQLKFFVAPLIRPGIKLALKKYKVKPNESGKGYTSGPDVSKGDQVYEFRFLSPKAATLVGSQVKSPAEMDQLRKVGMEYQLFEAIGEYGSLRANDGRYSLPPGWDISKWFWFKSNSDVDSADRIRDSWMNDPILCHMPVHKITRKIMFPSTVLKTPASQLDESIVYKSSLVNGCPRQSGRQSSAEVALHVAIY
jgi:hypothetical protein